MTYEQALAALPPDAEWTSSFGWPGLAGYAAYFRTRNGTRYVLRNGTSWMDLAPFNWTVSQVDDRR
jgi:hypothetical protein